MAINNVGTIYAYAAHACRYHFAEKKHLINSGKKQPLQKRDISMNNRSAQMQNVHFGYSLFFSSHSDTQSCQVFQFQRTTLGIR